MNKLIDNQKKVIFAIIDLLHYCEDNNVNFAEAMAYSVKKSIDAPTVKNLIKKLK